MIMSVCLSEPPKNICAYRSASPKGANAPLSPRKAIEDSVFDVLVRYPRREHVVVLPSEKERVQ